MRRTQLLDWVQAGIRAVNPETLVSEALNMEADHQTVIAIGKAAPAMVWGVAKRTTVDGLCITDRQVPIPAGVELIVGEHPVPGPGSLRAGIHASEVKERATLALISGGGSSLCEIPITGIDVEWVATVNQALLRSGLPIETMNLVRSHVSQVKRGGLGPIRTLVLSDVAGQTPDVVSSGPTAFTPRDPNAAIDVIASLDISLSDEQKTSILSWVGPDKFQSDLEVIGDGMTAARAVASAAHGDGVEAIVNEDWIADDARLALDLFLSSAGDGVTIAAGEPTLAVDGPGIGGRNTHVSIEAARRIAGSDIMFAAIATDGSDGISDVAGAIVDGTTIERGGNPTRAIADFDSASYLSMIGDTVDLGDTGTNVADLWVVWRSGLY